MRLSANASVSRDPNPGSRPLRNSGLRTFLWPAAILSALVFILFFKSFLPDQIVFSNDGPLGANSVAALRMPGGFLGIWHDANYLGNYAGSNSPTLTALLIWILGPLYLAKFYVPLVISFAALCSWLFFRQLKFGPGVCLLGSLAVALNSDFLSTAAWGVGPQVVAIGFCFLALAALASQTPGKSWARVILAGFAIGMCVMEGADVGAIFSIFIAVFALAHSWSVEGPAAGRIVRGVGRIAVVALCAVFLAAHALSSLIGTQIKGVVGTGQDAQTRADRWDPATQWSLPKLETLGLVVPGLFGYKMDTPDGGHYWGRVGRDPSWGYYYDYLADRKFNGGENLVITVPGVPDLNISVRVGGDGRINVPSLGQVNVRGKSIEQLEPELTTQLAAANPAVKTVSLAVQTPQGFMRFTGGGNYPGVLVWLIALWAAFQALRRSASPFSPAERKLVWFWSACAVISLLLAYGRYARFYEFLYALPYFSTIRNPAKFLHVFSFAMVILFAYGIQGLSRRYLETTLANFSGFGARFKSWWTHAAAGDRRWVIGCFAAVLVSVVGWLVYSGARQPLERYLEAVQLGEAAGDIARFSIKQVGWFVVYLAAAVALLVAIVSGALAGKRAKTAAVLIGLFLVADLGRANLPWIIHWDYRHKYETYGPNHIIKFLREKPYEHRVATLPKWFSQMFQVPEQVSAMISRLNGLYDIEWTQHLFLYYNIQCLDIIQMPRMPQDMAAYEGALAVRSADTFGNVTRRWELTNTRYLIGFAGFLDLLNKHLDPGKGRFRIAEHFDITLKPGITRPSRWEDFTAEPSANGPFAVFEFTGALPRASLFTRWQVNTNDQATLAQLADPQFDPVQTVLVASPIPAATNAAASPADKAGTVEFVSYAPKQLLFKTQAETATVLLVNDKHDPNWQVTVDGQPAELLRCNFIMRGVQVPPGAHTVEFVFRPPVNPLYVSLAAIVIGLALLGYVALPERKQPAGDPTCSPG